MYDLCGDQAEFEVEVSRVRRNNAKDRAAIKALPMGAAILAALQMPRPERCDALHEALPPLDAHSQKHSSTACPEMQIAEYVDRSHELPASFII